MNDLGPTFHGVVGLDMFSSVQACFQRYEAHLTCDTVSLDIRGSLMGELGIAIPTTKKPKLGINGRRDMDIGSETWQRYEIGYDLH